MFFHQAAEVAVGDDAGEAAVGMEHGRHAEAFVAHFVEDVGHWRFQRNARERVAGVHQVLDAEKLFAEASGGMQRGEIVVAKVAALQQRDGEGIADGHRDRGACRRSEIQGAGFFFDADVQGHVACFGERGMDFAGQRNQRDFQALQGFEQAHDFFGLAAVGDREHRVAAREHAEVAVQRFGRDAEKTKACRCSRRWRRFFARSGRTCPCR